jgi:hypothetical protein
MTSEPLMWVLVQMPPGVGRLLGDGAGFGDAVGVGKIAVGDGLDMTAGVLMAVAVGTPGDGAREPVGLPHPERLTSAARNTALM